jgi:hypothetical protein
MTAATCLHITPVTTKVLPKMMRLQAALLLLLFLLLLLPQHPIGTRAASYLILPPSPPHCTGSSLLSPNSPFALRLLFLFCLRLRPLKPCCGGKRKQPMVARNAPPLSLKFNLIITPPAATTTIPSQKRRLGRNLQR